jgi:hypothetical protein
MDGLLTNEDSFLIAFEPLPAQEMFPTFYEVGTILSCSIPIILIHPTGYVFASNQQPKVIIDIFSMRKN